MAPPHHRTSSLRRESAHGVQQRVMAIVAVLACLLSSCSTESIAGRASGPAGSPQTVGSRAPGLAGDPIGPGKCRTDGWFDCDFRDRFAQVARYLQDRPGIVGVEVHDRQTGAVWSSADANMYIWTASSIKLAIAVNLMQRNRTGEISLSDEDWDAMLRMITESDNDETDYLWSTYGQLPSEAYTDYGLADVLPADDEVGVWGSELATPTAMAGLVDYALANLDPADADWLIEALTGVVEDQRWGVLALDATARAGAKNGWDEESTGWVVNSVGFVGPRERYSVAIMNDLGEDGDFDTGVETVSTVAELLFGERFQ